MRTPVVAGNWKMNGAQAFVRSLVDAIKIGADSRRTSEIVLCPAFPYLEQVSRQLDGVLRISLGAQNVSEHSPGAFTGEVSVDMLRDCGCTHVILGHSERRALLAESNVQIAEKFAVALEGGLTPILCVGESLGERECGKTLDVVESQLSAVLERVGVAAFESAILAYEPVWAIGTGLTASPGQAQEVHSALRQMVARHDPKVAAGLRIVYGGSVKAANAASLFECPDIDGGLVGGASLDPTEFLAICQAAG